MTVVRLDAEQLGAATAAPGPLLIIAGAGAGKTTTLVSRMEHQVTAGTWDASRILAVTHSAKAAGNLRARIVRGPAKDATARTFHATALALASRHWHLTGRPGSSPKILESAYPAIRDALRKVGLRDADVSVVSDVLTAVNWAQSRLIEPADYPASRPAGTLPGAMVGRILAAYTQVLDDQGLIDFAGLLTTATQLCQIDTVRAEVNASYAHFLVDEFQDTDLSQLAFLKALLQGRDDITAVGDPRQSIFGFKGADPAVMEGFSSWWPGGQVVHLTTNYRSTSGIVTLANLASPMPGLPALRTDQQAGGPRPALQVFSDETMETGSVARAIKAEITAGTPADEIAVLLRFNAQSAGFEQALTAVGVPYTVLDHERFFDRREVISALRTAWQLMLEGEGTLELMSGRDALTGALQKQGYNPDACPEGAGAAADRWEAQRALLALSEGCHPGDAREFLTELATRRAEAHTVTTRAVSITTIHKAKGLEWDVVFVPRLVDGSMPSSYARTSEEQLEERRLLYVAVTRARRRLELSRPVMRSSGSKRWKVEESPFLALLTPALDSSGSNSRASTPAQGRSSAPSRTASVTLSPQQETVARALRAWRAAKAKTEGLPEFSVISDAALTAIAVDQPTVAHRMAMCGGLGSAKAKKYGEELLSVLKGVPRRS